MSSFNTCVTSLKTKASVGARAAGVLKHCEQMQKHQLFLKTLVAEANDTDMFNHVLDSHIEAIANMIPEFKTGIFFKKPVKTTLVNPIVDKITILRDFIRHATTNGMNMDYRFPEKRQLETEFRESERLRQAQNDRIIVRQLEDIASARQPPAPQAFGVPPTTQARFPTFGTSSVQTASPATQARFPPFGTSSVQTAPPAFAGFTPNGAPTYTGLSETSNSVPRQPTVASASGPAHPPIKRPRFASTPKSKKQAVASVTEKMNGLNNTDTPKQ
jgi:hypothetical protein